MGAFLAAGCSERNPQSNVSGLSRDQFIELIVSLRNAQDSAKTPAEFETLKQQIFARAGASPESLSQFAAQHTGQVAYMAQVWDSIRTRLDNASGVNPR
ncbi:MAG: hypothetical protein ACRENP_30275 [Longimicrobiales bacterium]